MLTGARIYAPRRGPPRLHVQLCWSCESATAALWLADIELDPEGVAAIHIYQPVVTSERRLRLRASTISYSSADGQGRHPRKETYDHS